MGRRQLPYVLTKRDGKHWYYKLAGEKTYHSTGSNNKADAIEYVKIQWAERLSESGKSILDYTIRELISHAEPEIQADEMTAWIRDSWHRFEHRERIAVLFVKNHGICYYCRDRVYLSGRPGESSHEAQIDHSQPVAKGGDDYIDNCVLSCRACNLRKRTKTAEEFLNEKTLSSPQAR